MAESMLYLAQQTIQFHFIIFNAIRQAEQPHSPVTILAVSVGTGLERLEECGLAGPQRRPQILTIARHHASCRNKHLGQVPPTGPVEFLEARHGFSEGGVATDRRGRQVLQKGRGNDREWFAWFLRESQALCCYFSTFHVSEPQDVRV